MENATLLVLMGKSGHPADIAELVDLARKNRLFLSVVVTGEAPAFPYYANSLGHSFAPIMAVDWQKDFEAENAELGK
ncbi:hypothetical protein, partial [Tabrizicola sp.]|uniref:hypothetical protein n=1 Tax=Tabrizicola sp. TaxID=2005166 RepID=UPI003F34E7D1